MPVPAAGVVLSRSMACRNAASVLPEPVGAWMRTFAPRAMAGQPSACAGVGPSGNVSANQRAVGSEKTCSATPIASQISAPEGEHVFVGSGLRGPQRPHVAGDERGDDDQRD